MADNQKTNSRKKSGNSKKPASTTEGKNIQGQPQPHATANDCHYVKQEPPNVYVNIPAQEEKKWNWTLGNKIALLAVAISVGVGVFTYLLFREASTQSEAAIKAANATEATVAEYKREFLLANEPLIQIILDSLRIFPLQVGAPVTVNYYIENLREIPAKVIVVKTVIGIDVKMPDISRVKQAALAFMKTAPSNAMAYLPKETPEHDSMPSEHNLEKKYYEFLRDGIASVYTFAAIKYQNIYTDSFHVAFAAAKTTFKKDGRTTSQVLDLDRIQ
jgi:hypothetical protein